MLWHMKEMQDAANGARLNGPLKVNEKQRNKKWNVMKTIPGVVAEVKNTNLCVMLRPVSLVLFSNTIIMCKISEPYTPQDYCLLLIAIDCYRLLCDFNFVPVTLS